MSVYKSDHVPRVVHGIWRWSGVPAEETPRCGAAIETCFTSRTIYADRVTCSECLRVGGIGQTRWLNPPEDDRFEF